jgi:hypothetical protein
MNHYVYFAIKSLTWNIPVPATVLQILIPVESYFLYVVERYTLNVLP